ncbi:MAG: hypothetical protein ACLP7W_11685 [Solirubrobacteraceae bacterium]
MAIPAMRMRCSLALVVTAVFLVAGGAGVLAPPTSAAEPPEAPQAEFTGAVGYGFAVAMSADGRTAVVGQLGTAHGSVQEHDWTEVGGLVHVFIFDGSSWSEQATLRASDQSYDLLFGNSVAISADGNTVIVGDPGECAYEHICEHTAYVFTRLGTTWTQQAEFHGGSGFGGSVALSGDGNTALVGAGLSGWYGLSYGPEGNAPPTIFGRTGTTWTQEATLSTGAAPTMFDNFGHALALSADGKTALVGDPDANDGAGAAYVFTGSGSSWTQQTELSATALPDSSDLGDAVALSADGSTALIGAPYGSSGGTAYLYRDGGSSWTLQAQLAPIEAEGRSSGGWFGITVALNRNGSIALVGAPLAKEDLGAVYAFAGEGSNWGQLGEFVLANATPYDYFGDAVALNGEGNVALIGRYDPGVDFFRVPAPSPRIPTGTKSPGTTSSNPPTSTSATSPSGGVTTAGGNGPGAAVAEVSSKTGAAIAAEHVSVHVQRRLAARKNVHITFHAPRLPEGGYYYAVIVLKPYKDYTRTSPPPCATSSNMQRTDYGYPQANGQVALSLTPAKSSTGHWCPGGSYEGAIYAVPHAPPCESAYPCNSEPYKEPCAGIGPGCVLGVVARPKEYAYPDGLPRPRATGTTIVARFSVRFP